MLDVVPRYGDAIGCVIWIVFEFDSIHQFGVKSSLDFLSKDVSQDSGCNFQEHDEYDDGKIGDKEEFGLEPGSTTSTKSNE